MKTDTEKLALLREAVERTFGRTPGSPSDFDELSTQIANVSHKYLGSSTLKRLWGYVKSPYSPTYSTLSVLAQYAGFRDWYSFCNQKKTEMESGFTVESIVLAAALAVGTEVSVGWGGIKRCVLVKIAQPERFEVVEADNIKLMQGDKLSIHCLGVGERFIATECHRADVSIGSYIGARKDGIAEISVRKPVG